MIFCGIDPGLEGAICITDTNGNFEVSDMPALSLSRNGKNKREIDSHGVARILRQYPIDHAFLELAGARPKQNASGVFTSGKGYGILIGALATLNIPWTIVSPNKWKRAMGVTADKDGARARASQLLPFQAHHWTRVKDDGRAEAALIALFGAKQQFGR